MRKKTLLIGIILFASWLRLWNLSSVPSSLFGDELDVGYQAYSIVKTGNDYYGNRMPLHFHSLAEYRTPLYLYSAVPTVWLFGVSPLGVRLPAALFGIATIPVMYLLSFELAKRLTNKRHTEIALLASLALAISPWHIQYSRAAFEVTEVLFFLVLGLWAFFKSFVSPKYIVLFAISLSTMTWIYSTAKLYVPIMLVVLAVMYAKELLKFPRKLIIATLVTFALLCAPMYIDSFFGEGGARFGYISVFSDPTTEPEIGTARLNDARVRGESGEGLSPNLMDRVIHNKFVYWGESILNHYYQSFSTDFLFVSGDPNLRHSIKNMGQLYKIDAIGLLAGIVLLFGIGKNAKTKLLVAALFLVGAIPASLTRDGGDHATRLFLTVPAYMFVIAYGLALGYDRMSKRVKAPVVFGMATLYVLSFFMYQHLFWIHNPWESERWWHAGFQGAISEVKKREADFDRVVISTANEPPWVFFAAWYEYPPQEWQENFPTEHKKVLPGFGEVSYINKFYFGSPSGRGLYEWGQVLTDKTLYVATQKEVNVNLILEPERTPKDLVLLKSIAYPSGEPAFYLFTGTSHEN